MVGECLAKLSQIFEPLFSGNGKVLNDAEFYKNLLNLYDIIYEFEPVIERNLGNADTNQCIRNSWEYLKLHKDICINMVKAFRAIREGDFAKSNEYWNDIKVMIQQREDEIQTALDVFLFIRTLEPIFTVDKRF